MPWAALRVIIQQRPLSNKSADNIGHRSSVLPEAAHTDVILSVLLSLDANTGLLISEGIPRIVD